VHVGDVAEAFCAALADDATAGKRLNRAAGPLILKNRHRTRETIGLKTPVPGSATRRRAGRRASSA
jgi:hypothetical protein